MFLYSRPFTGRAVALCGLFAIEVHRVQSGENELGNREAPGELLSSLRALSYRDRILHKNYLFRLRPDNTPRPSTSISLLFYDQVPFIFQRAHQSSLFPNTIQNISLMRTCYIRAFVEFLSMEICRNAMTELLHETAVFVQAAYASPKAMCLQRDYTNEEQVYVFEILEDPEKRSEIQIFDAFLRTTDLNDPKGRLFLQMNTIDEMLQSVLEGDPKNVALIEFVKKRFSSDMITCIGAYDLSGLQFLLVFSPHPELKHDFADGTVSFLQRTLSYKYAQDYEIAHQFTSIRHELRPLLGDIRGRFNYIVKSDAITTPAEETARKRLANSISDIRRNLEKSIELTDNFGQADNFRNIRDPALVTAEKRANSKHELIPLVPLILRARSQLAVTFSPPARLDLQATNSIYVRVDEENLVSILSKLLDNAYKYTPSHLRRRERPVIKVNTEASSLAIIVENVGPKIEEAERPNLFRKQFRGRHARRARAPGSGLGLYHAKNMAEFEHLKLDYSQSDYPSDAGRPPLTRHKFVLIFPRALWQ
jgi:signal transduction histidine kinase